MSNYITDHLRYCGQDKMLAVGRGMAITSRLAHQAYRLHMSRLMENPPGADEYRPSYHRCVLDVRWEMIQVDCLFTRLRSQLGVGRRKDAAGWAEMEL